MGFKMKGPGLPGFRKQVGRGFYNNPSFDITTSNRSPMKEGEDNDPNKHDAALQKVWNNMDPAEKEKYEAMGGWTKWSDWQYDILTKLEFRTKTGEFTEESGGGGITRKTHFGMNDACSDEFIAMYGNSECEKVTEIINNRSTSSTTNMQQKETRERNNDISYTNRTLNFTAAKGKSADDGGGMITVYDGLTPGTSNFVGTMSNAEFYAKYVGDGDLKVQTKKSGSGDMYENATGKLYMSQSFFDSQYTPMIDHKEQNRENRVKFEAEAIKNGMNREELTARLQNDPNLRLDVAGVHGFDKPIYGSGFLNNPQLINDEFLEQQVGLNFENRKRNSLAAQASNKDGTAKGNTHGSFNTANSVMPFNPNDFNYDDGTVSAMENSGVPTTEDWIFNMNEKQKRSIVAEDDAFDYHYSVGNVDKDGNLPSSSHMSGTSKEFFANVFDANTKKIDFSKLKKDKDGNYLINGRSMGSDPDMLMKSFGLSGLHNELGRSKLEALSSDLYSDEIKAELERDPTSSPEGETTKAIDNRVYDEKKGHYVDIKPRTDFDTKYFNISDRTVTDPTQETDSQREIQEEEE